MSENTRKLIIRIILDKISSQIKAVDYLSDVLDLGKESVYRRLRGEMDFTFGEISKLALELNFSIDELIKGTQHNGSHVDLKIDNSPEKTFSRKLQKYAKSIESRLQDETSYTIMALNYLPILFSVHFEELFKFTYYTWLHRKHKGTSKYYYTDVVVSPDLEILRKELDLNIRRSANNTFILDSNVFLGPLKEVHYFYLLGLINKNELKHIKEDFHKMIDFVEKIVRTNEPDFGSKHDFYLSSINIDSNSSYNCWNNNSISSFDFHFFETITFLNTEINETHKHWLESLKKYSTLITQSNEIIQAAYFEKQRKHIEEVENGY